MSDKHKPAKKEVQQYLAEVRDNAGRRESLEAMLKNAGDTLRQASDFLKRFEAEDPTGAKREAYRQDCGREPDNIFELLHWLALGRAPEPDRVARSARPFAIKASTVPDVANPPSADLFAARQQREAAIRSTAKSERALAKEIGVDRSALNKWKLKGRFALGKNGKSDRANRIEDFLRKKANGTR
jgi:hypothetical protein